MGGGHLSSIYRLIRHQNHTIFLPICLVRNNYNDSKPNWHMASNMIKNSPLQSVTFFNVAFFLSSNRSLSTRRSTSVTRQWFASAATSRSAPTSARPTTRPTARRGTRPTRWSRTSPSAGWRSWRSARTLQVSLFSKVVGNWANLGDWIISFDSK